MRVESLELKEIGFCIGVTVLNTSPFSVYTKILARHKTFSSQHTRDPLSIDGGHQHNSSSARRLM